MNNIQLLSAQVYTHKCWFGDLKCHWWSSIVITFKYFLNLCSTSKYLTKTLALTNVDFMSNAIWSMLPPLTLESMGGGNGWLESSRAVRPWILASFANHSRVCWESETKYRSTTCMHFWIQGWVQLVAKHLHSKKLYWAPQACN